MPQISDSFNLEAAFSSGKKCLNTQYLQFISGVHESNPHKNEEIKMQQIDVELRW